VSHSPLSDDHPRWSQLSARQRALFGNGCGAKGGRFNPPDFLFEASCDQHDFYYWRGGTEGDRAMADAGFFAAMRRDALRSPLHLRWFHRGAARVYYLAVRRWGGAAFSYRMEPKRWDDLRVAMEVNEG